LEHQIKQMFQNGINCSSTAFWFLSDNSRLIKPRNSYIKKGTLDFANCHLGLGSTLAITSQLISDLSGFDEDLRRFEDWDLAIRILIEDENFLIIPYPLSFVYRTPNTNWQYAESSLRLLRKKYSYLSFKRRFQILSGIHFELAVIRFRGKRYTSMIGHGLIAAFTNHYHFSILFDEFRSRVIKINFFKNLLRDKSL
jgi:hypothetical protein